MAVRSITERKCGQSRYIRRNSSSSPRRIARSNASSIPSHAPSMQPRLRPRELPRDSPQRLDAGSRLSSRGAAADVDMFQLGQRGRRAEILDERWVLIDDSCDRRVRRRPTGDPCTRATPQAAAARLPARRSSVPARVHLDRPRRDPRQTELRLDHLALLGHADRAVDRPAGCDRSARYVGPPPRPTLPPRPWNSVTSTPCGGRSRRWPPGPYTAPTRRSGDRHPLRNRNNRPSPPAGRRSRARTPSTLSRRADRV